jgi:hypothetical protein
MLCNPRQFPCNPFRWQHVVHAPRRNRAAWHSVELGRLSLLRKRHSALRLDLRHPERPIRPQPRKNHSDRMVTLLLRQRPHEIVNGHVRRARFASRSQFQCMVVNRHRTVRRDYVHMIRLHAHSVLHLRHLHRRFFRQQFRQETLVLGVQVLDDHEGHPGIRRQVPQQVCKRFDPSGRSSDRHNQQIFFRPFGILTIPGTFSGVLRFSLGIRSPILAYTPTTATFLPPSE